MSIYVNLVAIVIGLGMIAVVFRNMVKRRINERQSLIWFLIALALLLLGVCPPLLTFLSEKLGIWYPPAVLFAVAFVGLLLIVFYHTIHVSVLNNKVHELSMQVALLRHEIECAQAGAPQQNMAAGSADGARNPVDRGERGHVA